jgi:hypothetical protein
VSIRIRIKDGLPVPGDAVPASIGESASGVPQATPVSAAAEMAFLKKRCKAPVFYSTISGSARLKRDCNAADRDRLSIALQWRGESSRMKEVCGESRSELAGPGVFHLAFELFSNRKNHASSATMDLKVIEFRGFSCEARRTSGE